MVYVTDYIRRTSHAKASGKAILMVAQCDTDYTRQAARAKKRRISIFQFNTHDDTIYLVRLEKELKRHLDLWNIDDREAMLLHERVKEARHIVARDVRHPESIRLGL
jgi:hypothetical protein